MIKSIVQGNCKSVHNNKNNIQLLQHRYQLYVKQKQKLLQIQSKSDCFLELLTAVHNRLQKIWEKIVPISIRGSCLQSQIFWKHAKPILQQRKRQQCQSMKKFMKEISLGKSFQQDLLKQSKCICLFYTKQTVQQVIDSTFIQEIVKASQSIPWKICFFLIQNKNDQNQMIRELQQQTTRPQNQKNQQLLALKQLKSNLSNLKTKQSFRVEGKIQKSDIISLGKDQKQKLSFPLIMPMSIGIFDEIVLHRPVKLNNFSLSDIKQSFSQREYIENAIKEKVQLKMVEQRKQSSKQKSNQQMDSVHKIQVSQCRDHF